MHLVLSSPAQEYQRRRIGGPGVCIVRFCIGSQCRSAGRCCSPCTAGLFSFHAHMTGSQFSFSLLSKVAALSLPSPLWSLLFCTFSSTSMRHGTPLLLALLAAAVACTGAIPPTAIEP